MQVISTRRPRRADGSHCLLRHCGMDLADPRRQSAPAPGCKLDNLSIRCGKAWNSHLRIGSVSTHLSCRTGHRGGAFQPLPRSPDTLVRSPHWVEGPAQAIGPSHALIARPLSAAFAEDISPSRSPARLSRPTPSAPRCGWELGGAGLGGAGPCLAAASAGCRPPRRPEPAGWGGLSQRLGKADRDDGASSPAWTGARVQSRGRRRGLGGGGGRCGGERGCVPCRPGRTGGTELLRRPGSSGAGTGRGVAPGVERCRGRPGRSSPCGTAGAARVPLRRRGRGTHRRGGGAVRVVRLGGCGRAGGERVRRNRRPLRAAVGRAGGREARPGHEGRRRGDTAVGWHWRETARSGIVRPISARGKLPRLPPACCACQSQHVCR
jgi:hypothetical protein